MSEDDAIQRISAAISRPSLRNKEIVNELRHRRMDPVGVNVKDDDAYFRVYSEVMLSISADHPFLSREVERQVAKKVRWIKKRRGELDRE